jgi:hypothetical protein
VGEKVNVNKDWLGSECVIGYVKRIMSDDVSPGYYVCCEGEGAVGVGVEDYVMTRSKIDLEPTVVLWVKGFEDYYSVLVILDEEKVGKLVNSLQEAVEEMKRKRQIKILREKIIKASEVKV